MRQEGTLAQYFRRGTTKFMCGIVGYIGRQNALPIITDGLSRLEYRGYDSAGLVIYDGKGIRNVKAVGKLEALDKELTKQTLKGNLALGHTRWATHGPPSQLNAHPHADCTGSLMIVHNGIIDNYLHLKKYLKKKGHLFKSETDTEVIAHLIEEEIKTLEPPDIVLKAFKSALKKIEGTYAITLIHTDEPEKIFLARKDSPLVIGVQEDTKFAASDIPAFLEYTKKAIVLKNGEVATIAP